MRCPFRRELVERGSASTDFAAVFSWAWPEPDHPVGRTVGYHLRTGPHAITDYDWTQYLDFADRHLKNNSK